MNLITCTFSFFCSEHSQFTPEIKDLVLNQIETNNINYNELHTDIALRQNFQQHLIDVMNVFFIEQFGSHYLQTVFNAKIYSEERNLFPTYVFLDTSQVEFYEIECPNSNNVFIGSIDYLHQEVSALGDALGLVLTERDNYPGGKQKLAFGLIDMTWSALQSKFPLIIY